MAEPWVSEDVECPQCGGRAEPEEDGDVRFHACTGCGAEFGYQRVPQLPADVCQLGVPQAVRALMDPKPRANVFLGGIGRRPQ